MNMQLNTVVTFYVHVYSEIFPGRSTTNYITVICFNVRMVYIHVNTCDTCVYICILVNIPNVLRASFDVVIKSHLLYFKEMYSNAIYRGFHIIMIQ